MEFADVVRQRRMVRTFTDVPVPRHLVADVVGAGLRGPSAGFSQGTAFVVLEGPGQTGPFWALTARSPTPPRAGSRQASMRAAPVVAIALTDKSSYLARYAETDKAGLGLDREDAWPVPYWYVDAGCATMAVLLAATNAGLGALLFGVFHGADALALHLGVPPRHRITGAIALGWPAANDRPSPSLTRGRRPRTETLHYGAWDAVSGNPSAAAPPGGHHVPPRSDPDRATDLASASLGPGGSSGPDRRAAPVGGPGRPRGMQAPGVTRHRRAGGAMTSPWCDEA